MVSWSNVPIARSRLRNISDHGDSLSADLVDMRPFDGKMFGFRGNLGDVGSKGIEAQEVLGPLIGYGCVHRQKGNHYKVTSSCCDACRILACLFFPAPATLLLIREAMEYLEVPSQLEDLGLEHMPGAKCEDWLQAVSLPLGGSGLLKRYMLQPFETCLFPPK